MGKILGKGRSMIGYYANGKSYPDPEMIIKITNYFGISIDNFLLTDLSRPKEYLTNPPLNTVNEPQALYGDQDVEIQHLKDKINLLTNQVNDLREHIATQNMIIRDLKKVNNKKG